MKIILKTIVPGGHRDVMKAFDRKLFEALKPKGAKMEIVRFTGSKKGDEVHLRFLFPFRMEWVSKITDDHMDDHAAWFVDEGVVLPPGLKSWNHRHIVEKIDADRSMIIDDMTYQGSNFLIGLLLYPALYLAFYPRKARYRAYFTHLHQQFRMHDGRE